MHRLARIVMIGLLGILFIVPNIVLAQDRMAFDEKFKAKFNEIDADKDGKISLDEQLAECRKRCEERFKRIDADGDGFITREEDKEAFKIFREKGPGPMRNKSFMPKSD